MVGAVSIGGNCSITASIVALPQIPQLDELKTWRLNFAGSKRMGSVRAMLTTLSAGRSVVRQEVISKISFDSRTIPSVRAKPAASSLSCPGVRITTATGLSFDPNLERFFNRDLVRLPGPALPGL